MTKQDHIIYWKNLAENDLVTADYNVNGNQFVPALFFYHLATEKLLKAYWVKENVGNTPPFIHELQKLASDTGLTWDPDDYDYLSVINAWNTEARYPDYKMMIYQMATPAYIAHHQSKLRKLHQWLLLNL